MNKTSNQKLLSPSRCIILGALIAVGASGLFLQHIPSASAATIYPQTMNSTLTPDTLLW
jgi:hypothetical protein